MTPTHVGQVYEFEVDDELVKSIDMAAEDDGALRAFYQISLAGSRTRARPRDLLREFHGPVMLLWGEKVLPVLFCSLFGSYLTNTAGTLRGQSDTTFHHYQRGMA